jgi:hypothetical protein
MLKFIKFINLLISLEFFDISVKFCIYKGIT